MPTAELQFGCTPVKISKKLMSKMYTVICKSQFTHYSKLSHSNIPKLWSIPN